MSTVSSEPAPRRAGGGGDDEPDADPVEVTRQIALRRLDRRDYSRGELTEYLVRRRGCDRGDVDEVLDRLESVGLVDDRRFAEAWAASRRRSRRLSASAIARELRAKQVSNEIITETLAALDPGSEAATALDLARSRARGMRGLDRRTAHRRLAAALARKGYGPSVSFDAADRALSELED
ncbi:MAG: regulatory protein RecX [Propionibacteriaceae bacterium]|uniref:Regulatory protein RecX n=1 Tax=Propionibacterium ruminifibrarum TaxID=1962131 RepID=A0A375I2Z2_9ACTN|nr:regulatory protein RecX [Propionibacteriaceae bacterium]SPF67669.1 Regulatory protein RecX [recX] [Propionibacterium ruminifibrarum]